MSFTNPLPKEISAIVANADGDVNLTNCDREPIHTPNLIQPYGVLIAVSLDEYRILQVSLNTAQMLGVNSEDLLNKPLQDLLGEEQVRTVRECLAENFNNINPIPIEVTSEGTKLYFMAIAHHQAEIVIIELKPRQPNTARNFF